MDFNSHESLIDVNITIINDELIESNETFVIFLRSDTGVTLSPYAKSKVIIHDDDAQTTDNKGIAEPFILCTLFQLLRQSNY